VQPGAEGEQSLAGTAEGDIEQRFRRAGLEDVIGGSLLAKADYAGFDDFWEPFTYGVGPAGQHFASLTVEQRARVRDGCRKCCPTARSRSMRGPGTRPAGSRPRTECQPVVHTVEVDTSAVAAAGGSSRYEVAAPLRHCAERAATCDKRHAVEHRFE
jgi:hypothetical protein